MTKLASLFCSATDSIEEVPRMPDSPRIPCSFCLKQENAEEIGNMVSWRVNIHMCIVTGQLKDCNQLWKN